MAGAERALNFAVRVKGASEAATSIKSVGAAAKAVANDVATATSVQSAYEAAVGQASEAAAAFGRAQALARRETIELKAQLKAGKIDAAAYGSAVQDLKSGVALFRVENQAAARGVEAATRALVESQQAAQGAGAGFNALGQRINQLPGSFNKMSGSSRAGFQQLGFQISDVGTQLALLPASMRSYATIFAAQSGQIVQSISLMAGEASMFARVMSGPMGLAITTAISLLGLLASSFASSDDAAQGTGNAVDRLKDKLDLSKNSYKLLIDVVNEYNQAQSKSTALTYDAIVAAEKEARANLINAKAKLAAAQASAVGNAGQGTGGAAGAFAGGEASKALATVQKLQAELGEAGVALASEKTKMATDSRYAIEVAFDRELVKWQEKLRKGQIEQNILDAVSLRLAKEKTKALADFDKTKRGSANEDRQFGREVNLSQARSIAEGAGFKVSSGLRTKAEQQYLYDHKRTPTNPVALPGTSAHESGNALDILFGKGVTAASIRKAFSDQGVRLTKLLKEDGHFHAEFGTTGADKAQRMAESASAKAERERQAAIRRDAQFADALANANRGLLDARRANVHDAAQLAELARQDVVIARDKQLEDIDAKEKAGDYNEAKANQLRELAKQTATERLITINADEQKRKADEQLGLLDAQNDNMRDLLSSQLDLAKTAGERRKIQLALLAAEKAAEKRHLDATRLDPSATPEAKARALDRLGKLDQIYANRGASVLEQTAGPGEAFRRSLEKTPDQINEGIQQIKVDGLKTLNDGLVDAIVNFRSLGDVGRAVLQTITREMVQMSVERYITTPIAKLMFPVSKGAKGADALAAVAGGTAGTSGGTDLLSGALGEGTSAAMTALTTATELAATALNQFAARLATTLSTPTGSGGGGGIMGLVSGILGSIGGTTAATAARLAPDVASTIAANPGLFASGTDSMPIGRLFQVGENGRETMRYHGGGRLEVLSGAATHRELGHGGGTTIVQHISVPARIDPGRTASGIARSTQGALARANRKGLAMVGGRYD